MKIYGIEITGSLSVTGSTDIAELSASYALSSSYSSHFDRVAAIACSDETTAFAETSSALSTFRLSYDMNLTNVRASLTSTGSADMVLDVNVNGGSILSTKLTIDSGSLTSKTSTIPVIIEPTSASLSDDDEIKIDVDAVGTDATGLKIYLIGN